MRITWVTRSFLDYRIPLYRELAGRSGVDFTLLTSAEDFCTPVRVRHKAQEILGDRVTFLAGERCIGKPYDPEQRSNSVRRIFYQPGLIKKILATRPDIVITDAFNHWTLPVLWLRTHHNFRHIVCYERTAHTERNASRGKLRFLSFARHWVDAVHYNGVLCRDFLLSCGYPAEKLRAGNMTVDVDGFGRRSAETSEQELADVRKLYGIGNEMVFLYVGRLIPLKGLRELLHSWWQWCGGNRVSAKLLLVGDGPQEEELRADCEKYALDNVVFAGRCDYDSLGILYRLADVFMIPTLEDNWSLVVPEAMACGLPILCSVYNGCHPELVRPENGWTFDPLSPESLTGALQNAYLARADLPEMGRHSRRIVHDFSPEMIARNMLESCRMLLKQPEMKG